MSFQLWLGITAIPLRIEKPLSLTSQAQATGNPSNNAPSITSIISLSGKLYEEPHVQLSGT